MEDFEKKIKRKIDSKTKPIGALGLLEEWAFKIAKIQKTLTPELKKPTLLLFAADHGIEAEGVSCCPRAITWQQCLNMVKGGCGISVFCKQHHFSLSVIDVGVDYDFPNNSGIISEKIAYGSHNMLKQPAMTSDECKKAMKVGAKYVRKSFLEGCNVIGFGEMGIANTSPATLLLHYFTKRDLRDCVGVGAGVMPKGLDHKYHILKLVSELYHPSCPLEALQNFGGLEIAAITGAILEAKRLNMLILADGFIASSAFLVAKAIEPDLMDNVICCHLSAEGAHRFMLEALGQKPVLDIGLRLGEGTGVPIAYPVIESALIFLNNMATFDEAKVFDVQNNRQP